MTNHPLGEEIYSAYASGALSGPMRLLVDSQSQINTAVARERDDSDRLAGALFEAIEPARVEAGALNRLFDVIDAEAGGLGEAGDMRTSPAGDADSRRTAAHAAGQALDEILRLPGPVRDLALDNPAWAFAGPGVRKLELMRDGSAKAELIRLEPGHGVPHHGHECREFTLVLCGAFHDGRDRYAKGELCVADPALEHKPVAEPGEVCIALAVTDGPLAFTGPLGWIQRALGGLM